MGLGYITTPYGYGFDGVMYVLYITTPYGYGFVGAMFVLYIVRQTSPFNLAIRSNEGSFKYHFFLMHQKGGC
jgi:hypothetical protein